MKKWDEIKALYDAQTIVLSRLAEYEGDTRMDLVLFRLDERVHALSPSISRTPHAKSKVQLNDMVYGKCLHVASINGICINCNEAV